MFAKIFQPAQSAMQSGNMKSKQWVLEFTPTSGRTIDPLTGTVRSSDPLAQVQLKFDSLEDAVSYAKDKSIPHRVIHPRTRKRVHRSYADNFSYERKLPWTH